MGGIGREESSVLSTALSITEVLMKYIKLKKYI